MKRIVLFVFTILFFQVALAELQVFPLRVVLSEKMRSAQVSVRHRGDKPMRYRITAVFYRMQPNGSMELVESTKPEDLNGKDYFKFTPKQVELEPNVEQVVRLMLRLPADVADGEYRCHLHFEGMEEVVAGGNAKGNQAQLNLKARMAVAIPIIISKGENKAEVTLKDFKISKNPQGESYFTLRLDKVGKGFVYGDFEVFRIDEKGREISVGMANGVSSYIPSRQVKFGLSGDVSKSGKYKAVFKQHLSENERATYSIETVK